jgi:signal transduction histidine kinase
LKIFNTYRQRVFLILVILAFVPLLAAVTISLTVTRDLHLQQTINQLETLSELKTNQVRAWIGQGQDAVRLAATLFNTHQFLQLQKSVSGQEMGELAQIKIQRDVKSITESFPFVRSISILHPITGRVEYSTDPSLKGRLRSREIYFKIGREKIFVSPINYSAGREKHIMHISRPIRDERHELLAVVAAEMDLSDLDTIFKKRTGLGETGLVYLVDSFGFYVSEPVGESQGVLRKIAQTEGVRRVLAKEKGYGFYDDEKGSRVLGVYRWLEFSNMGLLLEIENSELVEPIRRVWALIIILGACLLGLVILAANYISIWLVSPIKKMASTAGALQEGDYSVRARLNGPEEARFLAAAFNGMAENIQASHENLERLVLERTGELKRSNERLKREIADHELTEQALQDAHNQLEVKVAERTYELARSNELLKAEIKERLQTEEALKTSEKELHDLSAKLLESQEEERKRIGDELHDGLAQTLGAIKICVETAQMYVVKNNNGKANEFLQKLIPMVQTTIEETRSISKNLHPPQLEGLGVNVAIKSLIDEFEFSHRKISFKNEIDIPEKNIPLSTKIAMFRVVQEALNNVTKHSQADSVYIFFKKFEDKITFTLEDNGRGFDYVHYTTSAQRQKGLGLVSMTERVKFSGGQLFIESSLGKGTKLTAVWPYLPRN